MRNPLIIDASSHKCFRRVSQSERVFSNTVDQINREEYAIPRWVGDTHFMAVLGEVRVIPEHVLSTYDKLFPLFSREK
jgi:hypothetical protein